MYERILNVAGVERCRIADAMSGFLLQTLESGGGDPCLPVQELKIGTYSQILLKVL